MVPACAVVNPSVDVSPGLLAPHSGFTRPSLGPARPGRVARRPGGAHAGGPSLSSHYPISFCSSRPPCTSSRLHNTFLRPRHFACWRECFQQCQVTGTHLPVPPGVGGDGVMTRAGRTEASKVGGGGVGSEVAEVAPLPGATSASSWQGCNLSHFSSHPTPSCS